MRSSWSFGISCLGSGVYDIAKHFRYWEGLQQQQPCNPAFSGGNAAVSAWQCMDRIPSAYIFCWTLRESSLLQRCFVRKWNYQNQKDKKKTKSIFQIAMVIFVQSHSLGTMYKKMYSLYETNKSIFPSIFRSKNASPSEGNWSFCTSRLVFWSSYRQ